MIINRTEEMFFLSSYRKDSKKEESKKKVDDGRFKMFYNDLMFSESLSLMNEMRRQGNLCDVTLKVENYTFRAHRIILVGAIPYFRAMFTNNMAESRMGEIIIKEIDPSALESLINYAYSATVRIDYQNALSLLAGASFLQLIKVKEACGDFLISRFNAHNVLGIRQVVDTLDYKRLIQAADNYINTNFCEVSESQEFLLLTSVQLIEIIERDDLEVHTEEVVFVASLRWVKYDKDERTQEFPAVFSRVRLPMLTPQYLVDHVDTEELVKSSPECRKLVDEAKNYYLLPERRNQFKSVRTRPRCAYRQIFILGHCIIRNDRVTTGDLQIYDPISETQTTKTKMSKEGDVDDVAVVGAKLYVFGHNSTADSAFLQIYDSKDNKWSEGSRMHLNRRVTCINDVASVEIKRSITLAILWAMGVAVLNDAIYLCGGEIMTDPCNTVECFKLKTGEWTSIALMLEKRNGPCAASLDGYIYVLGGDTGSSISNSVERYDPLKDMWINVKPMLNKRSKFDTAIMNGKLYACGGYDGHSSLQSVEVYHPNTDTWNLMAPMNCKRRNFGLVVYTKKLWAIGGYDGEKDLTSVEVYDPETNKWTFAPALNESRSCVCAGVMPIY